MNELQLHIAYLYSGKGLGAVLVVKHHTHPNLLRSAEEAHLPVIFLCKICVSHIYISRIEPFIKDQLQIDYGFQGISQILVISCKSYKSGGRFKNTYELLNLRALKFSYVNKIHIFQCMGKIFCVEFQRYPLKLHTKYLTHTLKDMIFMQFWNFKSS